MQLCMHIGLHQTGSASFQVSAFNSAPKLAEHGVVYPTSGAFVEGRQHLKLAGMLERSELSLVLDEFQRLSHEHSGARYLVISSDDLSSALAKMDQDAATRFVSSLSDMFSRVSYFGVVRPEVDILRRVIREHVEVAGLPYGGYGLVSTRVNDFFRRVCRLQSWLPNLHWVDFEKIKGEHLARRLLAEMTSIDVDFETVPTHTAVGRAFVASLLSSQLRLLHCNMSDDEHVHPEHIRTECEALLGRVPIDEAVDRELEAHFVRWLGDTLSKVADERARAGAVTRAFEFSSDGVRWSTSTQPDGLDTASCGDGAAHRAAEASTSRAGEA